MQLLFHEYVLYLIKCFILVIYLSSKLECAFDMTVYISPAAVCHRYFRLNCSRGAGTSNSCICILSVVNAR
jgi:hypothetical protein